MKRRNAKLGRHSGTSLVSRDLTVRGAGMLLACAVLAGVSQAAVAQGIDSVTYPLRGAYAHLVKISSPYDSEHDKTVLQTAAIPLSTSLGISALSALDGRAVTTPATGVVLTFWSTARPPQYAENRDLRLILNDSLTIDLGKAWLTPNPAPGFVEVLLKSVSVGRFLMIANARTVRIQLGATDVRLPPAVIEGLRDFASRMAPTAKAPR